jgi:hypothetical protein
MGVHFHFREIRLAVSDLTLSAPAGRARGPGGCRARRVRVSLSQRAGCRRAGSVVSVSLRESARPDLKYILSGGREGSPMGCGDASCWCGGGPGVRRAIRRQRELDAAEQIGEALRKGRRRPASTGDGRDRAAKDPRYSWLPPA